MPGLGGAPVVSRSFSPASTSSSTSDMQHIRDRAYEVLRQAGSRQPVQQQPGLQLSGINNSSSVDGDEAARALQASLAGVVPSVKVPDLPLHHQEKPLDERARESNLESRKVASKSKKYSRMNERRGIIGNPAKNTRSKASSLACSAAVGREAMAKSGLSEAEVLARDEKERANEREAHFQKKEAARAPNFSSSEVWEHQGQEGEIEMLSASSDEAL